MKLNLKTATLQFSKNNKLIFVTNNIKRDKNLSYSLAVYLDGKGVCVQILSASRRDNWFFQYCCNNDIKTQKLITIKTFELNYMEHFCENSSFYTKFKLKIASKLTRTCC